jgi:hypothetical protein
MDQTLNKSVLEPWVDAEAVAAHLGFEADYIRKLANKGIIPGSVVPGRKRYWRFKISEVDRAYAQLNKPPASSIVHIVERSKAG